MYDVIVIGAGINGSATAYELRNKQQKNVLLLEQFPLPHTRGSSHGHTRITRCLYAKKIYSQMTFDSFPIWRDLEQQTGERLYINNGCIQVFDEHLEQEELQNAQRICEELKVPHEILTADEVNERYKPFHIQQHSKTLLDTFGGTLIASKCLTVLQVRCKTRTLSREMATLGSGIFLSLERGSQPIPIFSVKYILFYFHSFKGEIHIPILRVILMRYESSPGGGSRVGR
uniref:FAD dependent oxidoreductase domain-containing protein n=1 Tax=Clytia hemisphaerica TaxID=252671 RepID=A0A7M5WIM3_9CNID